MKYEFFKRFGDRLQGASAVLFLIILTGQELYPIWAKILAWIVLGYFLWFGSERFTGKYTKII